MKTVRLILIILMLIAAEKISAQNFAEDYHKFYAGLGTSIATFAGGDFGSTYQFRFFPGYNDDYYYDYGYNNYYNDYYDRDHSRFDGISPIEISLFLGSHLNEYLSAEIESAFIWHPAGRSARNYVSGNNYLDFNDSPELLALPVLASLKIYPFNRYYSPLYFSAGGGAQFTHETMDRVRSYYNSSHYYDSYNQVIASYSAQHWYPGVKFAIGYDAHLNDFLYAAFELKYQNFFNNNSRPSPLAMLRSKNIGYIGLATKFYFSF